MQQLISLNAFGMQWKMQRERESKNKKIKKNKSSPIILIRYDDVFINFFFFFLKFLFIFGYFRLNDFI